MCAQCFATEQFKTPHEFRFHQWFLGVNSKIVVRACVGYSSPILPPKAVFSGCTAKKSFPKLSPQLFHHPTVADNTTSLFGFIKKNVWDRFNIYSYDNWEMSSSRSWCLAFRLMDFRAADILLKWFKQRGVNFLRKRQNYYNKCIIIFSPREIINSIALLNFVWGMW